MAEARIALRKNCQSNRLYWVGYIGEVLFSTTIYSLISGLLGLLPTPPLYGQSTAAIKIISVGTWLLAVVRPLGRKDLPLPYG